MTDRCDAPLLRAYTRWLADHDVANPDAAARELLHMARGHGWRPIQALQSPPHSAGRSDPTEEFRQAKAALTGRSDTPERRS